MQDTSTQPSGAAMPAPFDYRFISLASLGLEPAQLDFYQLLLSCAGEDHAEEKMRQVLRFRMDGYGRASFIGRLDALPAPLASFPQWRAELEGWLGELAREDLLARAGVLLGQPAGAFLASAGWRQALPDVWQSLLALAWTQAGNPADAALAAPLTEVLRVGHFLHVLAGDRASLASQGQRRAALAAQLVLPDMVTPPR
ncbi:hypothetical protein [Janthinobacterium sp. 1_2014MBL_MicDiv]|uniref:hypothetical protein n=1 Tax=Janthinobacterium sp. 1_2014MBL_MicDiv TaxID=1644131 RepID=UPI0008F4CE8A|nr:hypothetical protein [Janthinobacterium sp. 1_2014MBL_MicDiv]APA67883.1 hypothetical protein YQ44_08575 [Janthinobacterium sp. 1_2014MBL_MicDiv]